MRYQDISANFKKLAIQIQKIIQTNTRILIYRVFGKNLPCIIRCVPNLNKKNLFANTSQMR
ncbi:hypothetical protein DA103_15545 [Enterobacter cloacae]|uniref:Uncharacterized protein n=1 Tax=Enterobacter cloacae TaxID=550 RepID=A0A2T4XZ48_ENTCL|nr:hypothetical protein DA103_15545 [Enterobacter cloacae]RWS53579.1 hypothetical protein DN586_19390 [Enterobacter cloacae]RXW30089.1 hypothetical protein DM877_06235 [Enterobacter cloacae]TFF59820.1 hypothetical protein EIC82_01075 [Enterobacter sp. A11]